MKHETIQLIVSAGNIGLSKFQTPILSTSPMQSSKEPHVPEPCLRCIHAETVDLTTSGIMILPCDYVLDIIVFSVGDVCKFIFHIGSNLIPRTVGDCDHALYTIFHWSCIIFGTL